MVKGPVQVNLVLYTVQGAVGWNAQVLGGDQHRRRSGAEGGKGVSSQHSSFVSCEACHDLLPSASSWPLENPARSQS